MPYRAHLSSTQRAFLELLARASACNPFSDEFDELRAQIAGGKGISAVERWNLELHALHQAGLTNFTEAAPEDRDVLRYAGLYEIYHRYISAFDELIETQIEAGPRSLP